MNRADQTAEPSLRSPRQTRDRRHEEAKRKEWKKHKEGNKIRIHKETDEGKRLFELIQGRNGKEKINFSYFQYR